MRNSSMARKRMTSITQEALARRVSAVAQRTEAMLAALLSDQSMTGEIERPALLMEAMRYTALGGGKRFRPFLVVETAKLLGKAGDGPLRAGAALELIHCYSLVHDDLPAMDNDDLRRGKPTVHKAYDEAMAILVGDGLLTLAFDVLADKRTAPSAEARITLVKLLAQGAGIGGMVGGQMLDLAAEGRYPAVRKASSAEANVIRIQSMKTGALIATGVAMGAVLGGASKGRRAALSIYANALGLAFQIKDDLLDVEGDAAAVGKATGKDAAAGKATFVSLRGIAGAKAHLAETTEIARQALVPFGQPAAMLWALLDFNMQRTS
jgi:farnesyl diphosphate synthase